MMDIPAAALVQSSQALYWSCIASYRLNCAFSDT